MGASITAWGTALPSERVDNSDLAEALGVTETWIEERTGISSRRIAGPAETTASLAAVAGSAALARAELPPDDVDVVIVATTTPDHQIPATAPVVQDALGARKAGAVDVGAGCAGFLYGLAQAVALIEAGMVDNVLLCGADVLSRVTDRTDRKSCVLFGDGAAAVVVRRSPHRDIGSFDLGSDGSCAPLLRTTPDTGVISMQGREVYRHAVERMSASAARSLRRAGLSLSEIELVVAHQANQRILDAVAARLGAPADKVFSNIARLGNTSAASIPYALAEAAESGRIARGDLVLLTAFGAGFVWASCIARWSLARIENASRPLAVTVDA